MQTGKNVDIMNAIKLKQNLHIGSELVKSLKLKTFDILQEHNAPSQK